MPPLLDIPPSGSFNAWSQGFEFPDLLLAICKREQSGELKFMSSEAEKTILVHDGEIVFAKSSSTDDRLGPYLLRENLIRFEHMTELSRFVSPEKRFGTVLVENGVLDPHELVQGVVGQVRSIVLSLFQWTEAAYIFEQREPDKEDITLRIPLNKLIVDGVRQVTRWRRVMGGIGSLDAAYQTIAGVEDTVRAAKLTPEQLDLVADMRGPKTIAEACAATEISDFEVCQLLWAYCALGWVGPVTEIASKATSEPEIVAEEAPAAPAEPIPVVDATPAPAEPIPVVDATPAPEPMPVIEAPTEVTSQDEEAAEDDEEEEEEEEEEEDLEGLGMVLKDDPFS